MFVYRFLCVSKSAKFPLPRCETGPALAALRFRHLAAVMAGTTGPGQANARKEIAFEN
jgi:hypothetical protein